MALHRDEDGTLPAYAWPGGYPVLYLCADNGILCPACANGQNGSEASESIDAPADWRLVAHSIHWEGPAEICEHCGAEIESAYGDPDEPDFKLLFFVTYEIVTAESAEHGDVAERGFVGQELRLRDAIDAVTSTRTSAVSGVESIEASASDISAAGWITVCNGMEFETGSYESRSLHIPDSVTTASRGRILRLMRGV